MVQTLEAIRGGGGSVKVGTTGTISALMSRELESAKSSSKGPSAGPPDSISGENTPRKLKPRTSVGETSSSSTSNVLKKAPETPRKGKQYTARAHQIPMLTADNISIDGTPIRPKPIKKGAGVVEIVDIKCGAKPITNRLKKLGFSRLTDNVS